MIVLEILFRFLAMAGMVVGAIALAVALSWLGDRLYR